MNKSDVWVSSQAGLVLRSTGFHRSPSGAWGHGGWPGTGVGLVLGFVMKLGAHCTLLSPWGVCFFSCWASIIFGGNIMHIFLFLISIPLRGYNPPPSTFFLAYFCLWIVVQINASVSGGTLETTIPSSCWHHLPIIIHSLRPIFNITSSLTLPQCLQSKAQALPFPQHLVYSLSLVSTVVYCKDLFTCFFPP